MRYAIVKVKCGPDFIDEVTEIMMSFTSVEHIFLYEFLHSLKEKASIALTNAEKRINDSSVKISTVFPIICPVIIRNNAQLLMLRTHSSLTDFYLLMEHILEIPDEEFVA